MKSAIVYMNGSKEAIVNNNEAVADLNFRETVQRGVPKNH